MLSLIDLSQYSTSDILLVGAGGLILLWIFFKVARTFVRLAIFAIIILALYFVWTGNAPKGAVKTAIKASLQTKNIADLHDKVCQSDKQVNVALCECIYQPVYSQLSKQYSRSDIAGLEKQAMIKATMKAYDAQETTINACLKNKKEDKLKIIDVLKEQVAK